MRILLVIAAATALGGGCAIDRVPDPAGDQPWFRPGERAVGRIQIRTDEHRRFEHLEWCDARWDCASADDVVAQVYGFMRRAGLWHFPTTMRSAEGVPIADTYGSTCTIVNVTPPVVVQVPVPFHLRYQPLARHEREAAAAGREVPRRAPENRLLHGFTYGTRVPHHDDVRWVLPASGAWILEDGGPGTGPSAVRTPDGTLWLERDGEAWVVRSARGDAVWASGERVGAAMGDAP